MIHDIYIQYIYDMYLDISHMPTIQCLCTHRTEISDHYTYINGGERKRRKWKSSQRRILFNSDFGCGIQLMSFDRVGQPLDSWVRLIFEC